MGIPLHDFLVMQSRLKAKDLSIFGPAKGEPVSREGKLHEQIMEHCRANRWLVILPLAIAILSLVSSFFQSVNYSRQIDSA